VEGLTLDVTARDNPIRMSTFNFSKEKLHIFIETQD